MFAAQEQKIIDRLKERLGDAIHVGAMRELERVPEMRQRAPAVWVIYDGYRVGDNNGPAVQLVIQNWFVVVATKSARGNGDESAARDEAGELCQRVIEALLGYHIGQGKYLRLNEAPGPEYDAGYCHVPLAFSCAATFVGKP